MQRQLDSVTGRTILGAAGLSEGFVRRVLEQVEQGYIYSESQVIELARRAVADFEPLLAEHLSDSVLAGWITGYDNVAQQFPPWLRKEFSDTIRRKPPNDPPKFDLFSMFESEPRLKLVNVENAAARLMERGIMTRAQFDEASDAAKRQAFTIAGGLGGETIDRVRFKLNEELREGPSLKGFRDRVEEILDTSPLAPGHLCFLPGTRVAGKVLAATKLWYDGVAIEIKTKLGNVLRVTSEHPILTSTGWKIAGLIEQGDKVICNSLGVESLPPVTSLVKPKGWTVDNYQVPTAVEDVFKSLSTKGFSSLNAVRPVSPLNFNSELYSTPRSNSNVSRVRPYRLLMNATNRAVRKFIDQFGFVLWSVGTPSLSTACGSSLLNPRFEGSVFSSNRLNGRPNSFESTRNVHTTPLAPTVFGSVPDFNAVGLKALDKSSGGDVQLFRNLVNAFSSDVTIDSVVDVKRIEWSGHVYDVQSDTGFVTSEGIITSNSNVYRTNLQAAYRDGRETLRNDPIVAATFPYQAYFAVRDARARKDHRLLETLGLNGTNVYRSDDPILDKITPPIDFNCRCSLLLYTLEKAASVGVHEAQQWLRTGRAPINPEYRYAVVSQKIQFKEGFGHRGNVGTILLSLVPSECPICC